MEPLKTNTAATLVLAGIAITDARRSRRRPAEPPSTTCLRVDPTRSVASKPSIISGYGRFRPLANGKGNLSPYPVSASNSASFGGRS
jgi:hypothetical protein